MLRAGTNKEMRIQRAAEELLQPDVLPNIQDWLSKISDKGTVIVLLIFSCSLTLLIRTTHVGEYLRNTNKGEQTAIQGLLPF